MHPQLAKTYGPRFDRFPCYCQPKLNGVRALYQKGVWQSRDQKVWKPKILEHLTKELSEISSIIGDKILDSELYVHGWRLQRINGAVATNRSEPRDDTPLIEMHVFDCIDPNIGYDQPFSRRWFDLYNILLSLSVPMIIPVSTGLCSSHSDIDLHFHHYTSCGYEGIMLRPDGPYIPGQHLSSRTGTYTEKRSDYLWKHKAWQDDEFECVGVTQGQGKASIGIGALVCRNYKNLTPVDFEVGTGFDDDERREYMKNPPYNKKIKVRYLELTADGKPFNPSFLCVLE